jgi:RNA polymerase sigma-70 factor (ECF subfamily)
MAVMNPEALADLVRQYAPALSLYAKQWCACPDDVVQASFLKLARQTVVPDKPVAWLFRVVRNASLDAARAARRRAKHETHYAGNRGEWFLPPDDPTGLDARSAARALYELPEEIREITILHLWGGLTFEDIAKTVGGSASTCYRRYAQGLTLLREILHEPCPTT